MKIEDHFIEDGKIIHAEYFGEFPKEPAEIDKVFKWIANFKKKYNSNRFLIDYRHVEYKQDPLSMAEYVDRLKKFDLINGYVAYLFEKDSESSRCFKLVLADVQVKKFLGKINVVGEQFYKMDAAIEWLKKSNKI